MAPQVVFSTPRKLPHPGEVPGKVAVLDIAFAGQGRSTGFDKVTLPFIQALGRVHARYGVREEHYDTVGAALMWTLDRMLGARFDDETADAWATAYHLLATLMIEAADEEARSAVA